MSITDGFDVHWCLYTRARHRATKPHLRPFFIYLPGRVKYSSIDLVERGLSLVSLGFVIQIDDRARDGFERWFYDWSR